MSAIPSMELVLGQNAQRLSARMAEPERAASQSKKGAFAKKTRLGQRERKPQFRSKPRGKFETEKEI
jgi:hypothetical protein